MTVYAPTYPINAPPTISTHSINPPLTLPPSFLTTPYRFLLSHPYLFTLFLPHTAEEVTDLLLTSKTLPPTLWEEKGVGWATTVYPTHYRSN